MNDNRAFERAFAKKNKNKKVNIGGAFDDIVSCCGGKTLLQLPPGGIWIWDTSIHTPIMMMIMRRRIWIWDLGSGIWDKHILSIMMMMKIMIMRRRRINNMSYYHHVIFVNSMMWM